jgi:hypothetical protein
LVKKVLQKTEKKKGVTEFICPLGLFLWICRCSTAASSPSRFVTLYTVENRLEKWYTRTACVLEAVRAGFKISQSIAHATTCMRTY